MPIYLQAKNYIAGSNVIPESRDEDGNYTISFKGVRFSGTKSEWILFARNLSNALKTLDVEKGK